MKQDTQAVQTGAQIQREGLRKSKAKTARRRDLQSARAGGWKAVKSVRKVAPSAQRPTITANGYQRRVVTTNKALAVALFGLTALAAGELEAGFEELPTRGQFAVTINGFESAHDFAGYYRRAVAMSRKTTN